MLTLLFLATLSLSGDPEGVVATAPRGADAVPLDAVAPTADARPNASPIAPTVQSLTTDEQIDRWIGARSSGEPPFAQDSGPQDDGRMHGFVSGAVGTGDFSAVSAGVSLPLGENGRLDLSIAQSRGGYGYGYPGYGYGDVGYGRGYRPTDFYGFKPRFADPFFPERIVTADPDDAPLVRDRSERDRRPFARD